ncbi:MAG TPA: S41 family peptidase [Thermoanaerobaculia bacterium]|nr:S41 family peptidase [Thermoanaerobaculia bacterium]
MKTTRAVLLLFAFLVPFAAFAEDDAAALSQQALQAYAKRQFAESADLFARAIAAGANDIGTLYNAACSNALAGRTDAAFDLLHRAIAAGYSEASHIISDHDLDSLHASPKWPLMLAEVEAVQAKRDRVWNSPAFRTPYAPQLSEDERVAGLSRLWAEAKFNFAYFDHIPDVDWDALYVSYLPRVRAVASTTEYYKVLLQFYAQLKDGHTGVTPPVEVRRQLFGEPALRVADIEGHYVVSAVYDPALGITKGTELVAIDGIPARQYAAERIAPWQTASTPQDLAARTVGALLYGAESSNVELTLLDAQGNRITKNVRRLTREEEQAVTPAVEPFEYRLLPGNIAYVALNEFGDDKAADAYIAHFDEIAKSDGLIFDVRRNGGGNSSVGYRVLSTLTSKPFLTSKWSTRDYKPTFRAWGRGEEVYAEPAGQVPPDGTRLYTKPVVVLTGARTYSAAEDFGVAFDAMKRGRIVGEPTGGSTGQPLPFRLPGGGSARVCTKRDTYPDGKAFVGVGIQPQLLVSPKLADFRAGKDTVLDAAVALLRK